MNTKAIYFVILLLLTSIASSCILQPHDEQDAAIMPTVEPNIKMQMKSVSESLIKNTLLYVFNSDDTFVNKPLNVTQNGTTLSAYIPVGMWNFLLLTCDQNIAGKLKPIAPNTPNSAIMWQTPLSDDGNYMQQTSSELRMAFLPNTEILENQSTKKETDLIRAVAKVQIILQEYSGFDDFTIDDNGHTSHAYAQLMQVPNTLAWNGELYPNGDNPQVSPKPIREPFGFHITDPDLAEGNKALAEFIIPAGKTAGSHKLILKVSMPLKGEDYFGKTKDNNFEIDLSPKANTINRVFVRFSGEPEAELNVNITVKEWNNEIVQDETFN